MDDKKGMLDYLPFLRKIPSSTFGLAITPLVGYLMGWIKPENVGTLIQLAWGAAVLVIVNDFLNAIVRKMGGQAPAEPKPEPEPPKPPQQ